jgi:mRNA-degrading endonuclease toxin of MazEF toxin-antitoxin module
VIGIQTGGVYWVDDRTLTLPPNDIRDYHDRRPVVVLSSDVTNVDSAWKTVLIVPTSSSTKLWTRYCVKLGMGVANLDRKTWARVPAIQPILKADLSDYLGALPSEKLEEIQGRLLDFMGLLN